jgi:hypothetical protein
MQWIRTIGVNHKRKLAFALASAVIGLMKVSDLYAQPDCWNGMAIVSGSVSHCFRDLGSTCVVCPA